MPVRIHAAMFEGNLLTDALACLGTDNCVVCEQPVALPALRLCSGCAQVVPSALATLPTPPAGITDAWYLGSYAGPVGALIREGKYRGNEAILRALGRTCAEMLPPVEVDVVVPVPSTIWRRMMRGCNPVDLLALPIARALDVPMVHPLQRARNAAQARVHHSARASNARGAYAAGRPVSGRILLVDDVVTTGATARACAEALLCAGAESVSLVTIAASPQRIVLDS